MSSSNTETRILQMQLDNKDFEDGVRRTIKSIEDLEEKLDLKNAGDGFQKVSAAANSVQMSHLESGLDTVTNKFTLMGQIGLQVLERISSKVVDTGEKILRAATVQPMIDGWGEFEMKTNSVQTILGGIRNQFEDQPTAIHAISESLDELNEYADKTIYNFAQMTENVGKFTNQGISLKDSTNAIKGIANWAAAVGANPAQMSRAMYNISQSLGAGSMQLIDWRSIRFANMATPEVKKLFAEVAKIQGTISEDGKVKIGKKTLDVLENFEETLKGGWLTNEVMAEAFSIYANAYSETELIEKYGEDLGKTFHEMGVYAEEAATKVRTFSQLMGVLAESLGSGWASTFDILFGGFEQQTEFLTAIKERIEEIINFQTEDRNTWLQNFSNIGGIEVFQDVILKTIDILSDFYWVFNDVAALVLNPFGDSVFNMSDGIFGPRQEGYTEMKTAWEGVKGIFDDISNTLDNFRTWMYTPNESSGRSPIHNLANALSGVAGVAGIAWQVLTGFGKFVFRIFKRFEPLVSSVLDLLGQIGGAIYNVFFNLTGQKSIEKVFEKIEKAVAPVIDLIVGLATAVVDLIHSFLGIDKAADDWTVLGERMSAFWDIFKYDSELTFADNMRNSLKNALISVFGEDTAKSMIEAWDTNIAPVLEQISGFFEKAFGDLNRVLDGLKKAAEADYSQDDGVKGKGKTFLSAFLEGYFGEDVEGAEEAYTNVLDVYQQIKQYYDEHVAPAVESLNEIFTVKLPELHEKIFRFFAGEEKSDKYGHKWREGGIFSELINFFADDSWSEKLIASAQETWDKVYTTLVGQEKSDKYGHKWLEGGVFSDLINYFTTGKLAEDWESIKAKFVEIGDWISTTGESVWNTIMDFLFGPEIEGEDGTTKRSGGAYNAAIEFLNPVWDWIQEKGDKLYEYIKNHNFSEMWEGLKHLLFGYNEILYDEVNPTQAVGVNRHGGLLTPIVEMLQPIADVFNKIKGWALEKIGSIDWSGIWGSIRKLFTGYDELVVYDGGRHKEVVHHDSIFERIAGFFDRIIAWYDEHKGTFEKVFKWIGGLGDTIWNAFDNLLSGKGFGGFEEIGTYLKGGFDKLIGKIFPDGFSLDGILGGIFGEGFSLNGILGTLLGGGQQATEGKESTSGGFDLMKLLGFSADAAEADGEAIADAANSVVAVLNDTEQNVGNIAKKGEKASNGILDAVSGLLPYLGVAGGIGLVSKVGDIITGVTGNRKPTILEQVAALIGSLGEPLKALGIAIAGAGFGEAISPGTIDKVFGHITAILDKVVEWINSLVIKGALTSIVGWGAGKLVGGEGLQFDSVIKVITGLGQGLSGIFEGLQTLYNLAWEVWLADLALGYDKDAKTWNFDKKIERVMGFVSTIMDTILGSTWWTGFLVMVNTLASGLATTMVSQNGGKGIVAAESIGNVFMGIGTMVSYICDGVAALMTASLIPGIMNIDIDKIGSLLTNVLGSLEILVGIIEGGGLASMLAKGNWWEPLVTLASAGGGLAIALGAIGAVAKYLIEWYLGMIQENLTTMAPAIYTFISNLTGALQIIASIGEVQFGLAEKVLSDDLPRLLGYINSDNLKVDKGYMNEVGSMIRDFGNRVYNGINSLSKAKDVFDKYSAGREAGGFPLEFFQEMTEALTYLQGDGIKELYDNVFGFDGFFVGNTGSDGPDIDGLNAFFSTIGSLGYVMEKSTEYFGLGGVKTEEKLVSTKEHMDAFQDAFTAIQTTFHLLVDDLSNEKFNTEKLKTLGEFLKTISEAGYTFSKSFYYESNVVKTFEQTSPITQFAGWLQTMGSGVRQLNDSLKTNGVYDINYEQIKSALEALYPMAEIEKKIYEYSKLSQGQNGEPSKDWDFMVNTQEWLKQVLPKMKDVGANLHAMAAEIKPEDVAALTSASGTLNSLASFMSQEVYGNIQILTTEQIQGYATAFGELKQSLLMPEGSGDTIASTIQGIVQATGGKPISLSIVPIIDDSNLGGNLPDGMQMDNTYSRMISMQMNMEGIQNVRIDSAQIEALVKANNDTRDKIDALATSIRNIRIQINPTPGRGGSYGPVRTVETYPLVANYQSPFEDTP